MAAAVVSDQGLARSLRARLEARLFLRLFTNDVPVLPTSVLDDFQVATFPGYADAELTDLWSAAQLDALGRAWSAAPDQVFTRGSGPGAETVYGWLLYEDPAPDSAHVVAKRFTAPYFLDTSGQFVVVSVICYMLRG